MAAIVLVPGAWMGGWAWMDVANRLTSLGHEVFTVTFSSMQKTADLNDHVSDVVRALETLSRQQGRLVLVGHSYGGLVAGLAADHSAHSPDQVVFVDSPVPESGMSMLMAMPDEVATAIDDEITATGFWTPPAPQVFIEDGVSADTAEWVADNCAPHPGATLRTPAVIESSATKSPETYVRCVSKQGDFLPFSGIDELRELNPWNFHTIESGHWPMFSVPAKLADLLADIAKS